MYVGRNPSSMCKKFVGINLVVVVNIGNLRASVIRTKKKFLFSYTSLKKKRIPRTKTDVT